VAGKLLHLLVRISGARRVLEIGTLGAYSTIWMARGLPDDGSVVTIEAEPGNARVARANLDRAGVGDKVRIEVGRAADVLPTLQGEDPFDLVFIDADKPGYLGYYEAVLPKLSPDGVILADNVLWSGRLVDGAGADEDASTRALREFNNHVVADERVEVVMLTVRDGVSIIRRRR
jgi:predicted O-methyltransferase YrrM